MAKYLRCGPNVQTLVDDDFQIPDGMRIGLCNGYAELRSILYSEVKNKKYIMVHRYIMSLGKHNKTVVDHINGDRLDNRKCNLRLCTDSLNGRNRKAKGVCFDKHRKLWAAKVMENKKVIYLGRFKSEKESILAVNAYKIANWGEFANPWPLDAELLTHA